MTSWYSVIFRRNPIYPFENDIELESFAMKYDTSLFLFGSNSKKHKNSLVMGRMYDCHVLDMVELQIENFVKSAAFDVSFIIKI